MKVYTAIRKRTPKAAVGPVEDAAVTVVRFLGYGKRTGDDTYQIEHWCCNKRGTITWGGLRRRIRQGIRDCKACAGRHAHRMRREGLAPSSEDADEKYRLKGGDYGVTPPAWPVLRQSMIGNRDILR